MIFPYLRAGAVPVRIRPLAVFIAGLAIFTKTRLKVGIIDLKIFAIFGYFKV